MQDLTSHVTIIAIGVSSYHDKHFEQLRGADHDIDRLRRLLVENPKTALFTETQFIERFDPTINELRKIVVDYTLGRAYGNDILLFYFSGHGMPIGRDDFGFCVTDTIIYRESGKPIPLSVLKFSDLLKTIEIAGVTPVIIIDACYSGMVARALSPADAVTSMQHLIHNLVASKFALLCSCSDEQEVEETPYGGVFSHYLCHVASEGIQGTKLKPSRSILGLKDIFPQLDKSIASYSSNFSPRLYIGPTLPDFPFVKNTRYRPNDYSFSKQDACIISALWADGNPQELTLEEISQICGKGAYGNHNKLSLEPWQLLEDVPNVFPQKRRLTETGIKFAKGEILIPKKILKDPDTEVFTPVKDTNLIGIKDF